MLTQFVLFEIQEISFDFLDLLKVAVERTKRRLIRDVLALLLHIKDDRQGQVAFKRVNESISAEDNARMPRLINGSWKIQREISLNLA